MTVTPGTRLGAYEVLSLLGSGGMGEVYRARDTKLNRDVALKVLPAEFAVDPDRMARFTREAQTLAALNHPNVAAIYGFEDAAGVQALVLELIEGETLADRLSPTRGSLEPRGAIQPSDSAGGGAAARGRAGGARRGLELDEALPIARQIAEALEAAHEQGIIHRDLKPGNIKLRPDGTVKVLDFGLAKMLEAGGAGGSGRPGGSEGANATASPTITTPAMTQLGVILGTAAYMSPEQASGKRVDKRADIWAFGVVLWEMLTGRRLFDGETVSHTLADVLRAEIDVRKLPATIPEPIRELLKRCLDRDVTTRLRDIGEARVVIRRCSDNPATATAAEPVAAELKHRSRLGKLSHRVITVLLALGLAGLAFVHLREAPPVAESVRFQISLPENVTNGPGQALSISPDGRRLIFVATGADGIGRLWMRSLSTADTRSLPGTEGVIGAGVPFWSPDSRFITFVTDGKLKKIDVSGGPPQTICDVANPLSGGFWTTDNRIVFAVLQGNLQEAPAGGGTASAMTTLDVPPTGEVALPSLLPDGLHFVYVRRRAGSTDRSGIYVGSLNAKQKERWLLPDQSQAMYVATPDSRTDRASGHLLFLRDGSLMAQRFDADRLELSGDPAVVAEQVSVFSASTNGILVYRTGRNQTNLTWFDRAGRVVGTVGQPGPHNMLALSRDGTQLAESRDANIWVLDLARGASSPLTSTTDAALFPAWSPDGSRVAFSYAASGTYDLYVKPTSGATAEELVFKSGESKNLNDWSRDGRFLLYAAIDPTTKSDLWVLPLEERKPIRFAATRFFEGQGQFSPDGHWIAYVSDQSGRSEIYGRPFPSSTGGGGIISQGGGYQPRWRPDGKELFYFSGDGKLMAVDVTTGGPPSAPFKVGIPRALFQPPVVGGGITNNVHRWDIAADGQRFLISTVAEGPTPPITVVLNWQAELKN